MEVQLKVKVQRSLKEEAAQKAKAENKSMKQLIEELLLSYVRGEQEVVQLPPQVPIQEEVKQPEGRLSPDDFNSYLEYVDYLERHGLIY